MSAELLEAGLRGPGQDLRDGLAADDGDSGGSGLVDQPDRGAVSG